MLGWFCPNCPVDPHAKDWIEGRLEWLASEFGYELFTNRVILPIDEFFPDEFDGSDESIRVLFHRVCEYMKVDPARVQFKLFRDRNELWLVNDRGQYVPRAVGSCDEHPRKPVIRLESSQAADPVILVGTMAHELAHVRLLRPRRISPDVFDHELLTDLTVVFHGLGVFLANAPRAWPSQFTNWPGTSSRRPGYMTQPMFGYALAHAAWFRNERKPVWAKHLCADARLPFKQGLRFLFETGDSRFQPQ